MSTKSDFVCAITMMYPVSLPIGLVEEKLKEVRDRINEVQNKHQEQTTVLEYLDRQLVELQGDTVSLSRLARMSCILQKILDEDNSDDFRDLFLLIASKGSANFQQLLMLYEFLEESEYSLQKKLLEWHTNMFQQYFDIVQKTWDRYLFIQKRLIKLRLRMRIDPSCEQKGLKWTFIADFDDVKQQLAREMKVLRSWRIQHHLLTQVQKEFATDPNLIKGIFDALLGQKSTKEILDVPDPTWLEVKSWLNKYIEQRCRNHSMPKIVAGLCGHSISGKAI